MAKFDSLNKISCLICGEEGGELCTSSSTKQIVFILSRVLKLPKDRIGYYLEYYSREESWVQICLKCSSDFVDKCVKVHRELVEIQKRQEESDGRLINKIKQTVKRRKEPANSSDSLNVTEEIRSFVVNHDYGVCTSMSNHSDKASSNGVEETRIFNNHETKEKCADPDGGGVPANATFDEYVETGIKTERLENESESEGEPCTSPASSDQDSSWEPKRQTKTPKRKSTLDTKLAPKPERKKRGYKKRKQTEKSGDSLLMCDMCKDKVPRDGILHHVQDHVKDYALQCPNCARPYCSLTFYNSHIYNCKAKGHTTPDRKIPTVCELCGFEAINQVALHGHLELSHESPSAQPHNCPVSTCSESFTHRQTVYYHLSLKHAAPKRGCVMTFGQSSQQCRACSKPVPQSELLEHFSSVHQISAELVISCKDCPYLAMDRVEFLDHLKIHFRSGAILACDLCPAPVNFSRLVDLRKHYFSSHQIGTSFPCPKCDNFFMSTEQLETHTKKVHDRSKIVRYEKRFKCDECPEDDPTRYHLEREVKDHKIKVHGADPYKCPSCPATFTTCNKLKVHEKSHKNVSVKKYPCEFDGCDKVFEIKRDLITHMTSSVQHFGRTNAVTCHICGATFNNVHTLRTHINRHNKEKKFVCDECGAGFQSPESLGRHVLIHTGELPFQCQLCDKRFRQSGTLWNHVKIVHEGFKRKRK